MTDVTHAAGGNGQIPPDDGWDWGGLLKDQPAETERRPEQNGNGLAEKLEERLLTAQQVLDMPPPSWLIDDLLNRDSLAVLYGKPASGKSFIALDWALCVAGGLHWNSREVPHGGPVLYIAAEGIGGIGQRVRAWRKAFNVEAPEAIRFLPGAVNLLDATRSAALLELVRKMDPSLVVIDTAARSMVGGDENSARDVGVAIDTADHLRAATKACVLLVHHTTKDGDNYRGSTALEGGIHTMVECARDEDLITLNSKKAKDAPEFDSIRLKLDQIDLGEGMSSCVVRHESPTDKLDRLGGASQVIVRLLSDDFSETGASVPTLVEASGIARQYVYSVLNTLAKQGHAKNTGTKARQHWEHVQ